MTTKRTTKAAPVPEERYVRMKCRQCRGIRDIGPGEVGPSEFPMCGTCFVPLVVEGVGMRKVAR